MAGIYYAKPSSGKLASAIGWIDLGAMTLTPPMASRHLVYTLPGGVIFSFDISTTGSGMSGYTGAIPTWSGAAMGNLGYTNIGGTCAIEATGNGAMYVHLNNISLKDIYGVTIPDYSLYMADAEATATPGEGLSLTSDGTPISQVDVYPIAYTCPGFSGNNTATVTISWGVTCTGPAYNSRIFQTTLPRNITAGLMSSGGTEALALGVSIQKVSVYKSVTNRISSTDQFNLALTGSASLSTITTGTATGGQTENIQRFASIGDVYYINETMAPGSSSNLIQYAQTVTITNTSGGTIPSNFGLGSTLPINAGDFMVVTIVNTPIPPNITPVKSVSSTQSFAGTTITYTLVLTNSSPNAATSVAILDTIPTGSSFIAGSIVQDGVATGYSLPTINLGTLPAYGTTTLTYSVFLLTTTAAGTAVRNSAKVNYSYVLYNSVPSLNSNSNIVTTTILTNALINSTKSVNETNGKFNDILTYTIVFSNVGTISIANMTFIDTVPTGVNFINNSVSVNGVTYSGLNPNPPGFSITIPSTLNSGGLLTITYKAIVTTLVNPTTITNIGSLNYRFTSGASQYTNTINSNTVATTINYVDFSISKIVDKFFVSNGSTITYTVVVQGLGNINPNVITFFDTIPNGATFVNGSVYLNGVNIPSGNPQSGVNLTGIPLNTLNTLTFIVTVN